MRLFSKYLLILFKLPAFLYAKLYNYISLKASNLSYSSYPQMFGKVLVKGKGRVSIGEGFKVNSSLNSNPVGLSTQSVLLAFESAEIFIGDNVGMSNSLICSMQKVTIESDVLIGGGSQIFDNDFHSIRFQDRLKTPDISIKILPVLIKRGAFIGCNSIIGKGVVIGERSVIAAGSVVSKNVPDDEIWGGNPAVFIKKIDNQA